MIDRLLAAEVRQRLGFYPAVAILGPRQVGKTTLAAAIAAEHPGAVWLDLERESDRAVLAQPELFFVGQRDRLVVLDEVQFVPGLFTALRPEIDAHRRPGRFLLLGSASGGSCANPRSRSPDGSVTWSSRRCWLQSSSPAPCSFSRSGCAAAFR